MSSVAGVRYVRTAAGAEFYGLPIGSMISQGVNAEDSGKPPITYARLLSIAQMAEAARRSGDDSAAKYYSDLLQAEYYRASANPAVRSAVAEVIQMLSQGNGDYKAAVEKAPKPSGISKNNIA